jgi:hypothetical protein
MCLSDRQSSKYGPISPTKRDGTVKIRHPLGCSGPTDVSVMRPSAAPRLPEKWDQAVPHAFRVRRVYGKLAPKKAFLDDDAHRNSQVKTIASNAPAEGSSHRGMPTKRGTAPEYIGCTTTRPALLLFT